MNLTDENGKTRKENDSRKNSSKKIGGKSFLASFPMNDKTVGVLLGCFLFSVVFAFLLVFDAERLGRPLSDLTLLLTVDTVLALIFIVALYVAIKYKKEMPA